MATLYLPKDIDAILSAGGFKLSADRRARFAQEITVIANRFIAAEGSRVASLHRESRQLLVAIERLQKVMDPTKPRKLAARAHAAGQRGQYKDISKRNDRGLRLLNRAMAEANPPLDRVRACIAMIERDRTDPKAFSDFIEGLAGLWKSLTGKMPGTSVNSPMSKTGGGQAGGPFVRFVKAAVKPLRDHFPDLEKPSGEKIRAAWRRLKEDMAKSAKNRALAI